MKTQTWETNKEKLSMLSPKMFFGHAVFIGGKSQKGSRYLSFPVYRCCPVDRKTEFNLNNILTALSLISISLVKQFAGKCPQT